MSNTNLRYRKTKEKYLQFIKSQEILSEPFRDKIGQLDKFYIPISKMINKFIKSRKTTIIGLSGGQGSGKSTISKILKIILWEKYELNTVIFSIDDFYKTQNSRKKMSSEISPLFLTRGVPGTHDTKLLTQILKNLKKRNFKTLQIPKFDKSLDDRLPKRNWQIIKKKPDVIIFEGWCVGAKPQKNNDLLKPINRLEKLMDKKRIWRTKVNNELKNSYKDIFNLIDKIIFLKVPSFKYVYKWRLLQEKKLEKNSNGKSIMSNKEIKIFVMHYERITMNMLKNLSKNADTVIKLDRNHRLKSITFN